MSLGFIGINMYIFFNNTVYNSTVNSSYINDDVFKFSKLIL